MLNIDINNWLCDYSQSWDWEIEQELKEYVEGECFSQRFNEIFGQDEEDLG